MLDALGADGALDDYPYLQPPAPTSCAGSSAGPRQPTAYRRALALTDNAPERAFLERRLAEMTSRAGAGPRVN